MADLPFLFGKVCLWHTQYIICNDVRTSMDLMLKNSDQNDGKVRSSPTSNGVIYHSTGGLAFALAVNYTNALSTGLNANVWF